MGVVQILRRAHLPVGKIIPVTIVGGNSITEGKLGGFNCCKLAGSPDGIRSRAEGDMHTGIDQG
jgi:hypothetical protein